MSRLKTKLKKFWRGIGPGLATGASDDDPSGIATYSIAGAKFGYMSLWTMLYLLPFMIAVQDMAARIGITSSCGLAGNIKRYYSKGLLVFVAILILSSNIFNIGADVAGMAAAIELLTPGSTKIISLIVVVFILFLVVKLSYRKIASIFKWLSLSLLVYVLAGFIAVDDWSRILVKTIIPSFEFTKDYIIMIVAIAGTTISPYLAFWQASEEAEEKKMENGNRVKICKFRIVARSELRHTRRETAMGMFFSNFIGFFIIALTGSVLFSAGVNGIETIEEAATALQPLAGQYAYLLFTLGIVSAGLLAIPILAGSAAYVLAEMFGWEASLDKPFNKAKEFYVVIIASTALGLLIPYLGISPIKALFYTAIIHGIVAPFLIGIVIHMANNPKIVGPNHAGHTHNLLSYLTMIILAVGTTIFFITL
ncbi:MAG: divalent metal cation transporter [Candidatus Paceibacterota bacterium]